MRYVLIALSIIVVLVVLYLVARRVKPFGYSVAFVCTVLSRLNVKLAEYLIKAADYCQKACLASLRYPPGVTDLDYWSGVVVLSRLVYFLLAACILGGETVNTLLVLPSLFQTASHLHLPGIVELASAALFIATPAFLGAVLLECCGLVPHGFGLFPPMRKLMRWVVGVLAAVFLLLAIALTGYFYLYRAAYLLDPQSTQGMSLLILSGLGLEIAAVSILALLALVVGGAGVVSLLLWTTEHLCRIIAAVALFLPSLLDVLAVHLSGGTMSVTADYIGPDPYQLPASSFPPSGGALSGYLDETALVPMVAVSNSEKEHSMFNPDKNAAIVCGGPFGSRMLPLVAHAIARLRATENILTSAWLDLTLPQMHTTIPGINDLSSSAVERNTAMIHGESEQQAYTTLFTQVGDRLIERHQDTKGSPAPLFFVLDCRVLSSAVAMLTSIKRRLPLHSLVVITSLSALDVQNTSVQTGIAEMQRLVAEDIIDTVLMLDPRSPFAKQYGENTQLHFLAQVLVSLVIAHKHSLHNRSCTNLFQELHRLSPFATLSVASEAVAVGKLPNRWAWVPFVNGHAGTGNYSDVLAQTRAGIHRVFFEETARAFPAQVHTDASCILLCTSPYEINNRRFADSVRDNNLHVSTHYPYATSITVRGNGIPYPTRIGSRYLVTVALLYPLHPAALPQLPEPKHQETTVLPVPEADEPINGTGATHAQVPQPEVNRTTASLVRAPSASPVKGRGRKQTKATK